MEINPLIINSMYSTTKMRSCRIVSGKVDRSQPWYKNALLPLHNPKYNKI